MPKDLKDGSLQFSWTLCRQACQRHLKDAL